MESVRLTQALDTIPSATLLSFLALAFAITWSVIGFYILAPSWASAQLGEISGSHPLFFLATSAPGIAAIIVVQHSSGWRWWSSGGTATPC